MATVGIVGAGIAGLHLGLFLQKEGVPVTLYAERSPDEVRAMRLLNTQSLLGVARARCAVLGVNHWDSPAHDTAAVRLRVAGDPPLAFTGVVVPPGLFVDLRLYLPRLIEDFAARGGTVVVGPRSAPDVDRLSKHHDLMVVATGRDGLSAMFPRLPERSPYDSPQRTLLAGLFRGIHIPVPRALGFEIVPGLGEIIEMPILTREGVMAGLLLEAVPGGPFEPLTHMHYEDDPRAFDAAMLALVRDYMPDTWSRTEPSAFGLMGPLDTLSGAVVPTVRRGFVQLPGGQFAMGIGDTHVAYDPVSGQGANAASRSAWLLGELIVAHAGKPFDEAFCTAAEQCIWERVRAAAEWTNAFLQPPPAHFIGLLVAAAQNRALADAFATNFDDPDRQWATISSPEATAAFIASFGSV